MESLAIASLIAGGICAFTGEVMLLVAAFRKNFWLGLACFLVPPAIIPFVIVHWSRTRNGFLAALAGIALMLAASILHPRGNARHAAMPALTVYCAAGLKKPVEAIAEKYRGESGVEVRLQYGPTGTLLSNIRIVKRGDLFIAADDGALADARELGVIRESIPLVRQHPVIGVRDGNPKKIHAVADLLRADVRVAVTNPGAASISRVSSAVLGETWKKIADRAAVMKPSVTEVAADLSLGTVDAAILWDGTVSQFAHIEAVEVPELSSRMENSSIAVLAASVQPVEARRFVDFLIAPEKGGAIFRKQGFTLAASSAASGREIEIPAALREK